MGQKPAKNLKDAPVVVIIGGGYGGITAAKALDAEFNVVLIDRKDYFLHNVGTPRGMVDTEFMKKLMIPYTALLKNGHVVKGQVTKVTDTEVHLQGQETPITGFKYIILATGTSYSFPYKVPHSEAQDVIPQYAEIADKISKAKNIVCVGGGSTGLEAATEIACRYPETKVTIVHGRAKLFDDGTFKQAFGDKLEEHISRGFPNVTLIKEDRLMPVEADGGEAAAQAKYVEPAGGKVVTQKGIEIPCDLLFWCVGARHNFASYEEHFAGAMERNGQLKVDKFLQVEGHPKVFVAGDISTAGPWGTVSCAETHGHCIAASIKLDHNGSAMQAYKAPKPMNATQLGTTMGAGCIPGPMGTQVVLGHFMVQKLKYDCFASKTWQTLGHEGLFGEKPVEGPDAQHLQNVLNMSEEEAEKLAAGLQVQADGSVDHT